MTQFDPFYADEQAKTVASALSTLVNTRGAGAGLDLAQLVRQDHRTLQQSVMRDVIVPLLQLWRQDFEAGRYDDRNEATVKAAALMVGILHTEDRHHFPFI